MTGSVVAVGVDGCRAGWVAAVAEQRPGGHTTTRLGRFDDLDALVSWREQAKAGDRTGHGTAPAVGLDVPMGLPARAGLRACDRQARQELGARWMSVFAPPDRELLGRDFASARVIVHRRRLADTAHDHPVMTRQTMNIAPKIAEADRVLRVDPRRQEWLLEVHPELSFRILAGRPLAPKRTPEGARRRLALIAERFPDAPAKIADAAWPRVQVAQDDLLDAYAALWTALRFAAGDERCRELGDGGRDAFGLRQRIIV
jgi:predicted RNase H-like nuclease